MIKANIEVVKKRLGDLNNAVGDLFRILGSIDIVEKTVTMTNDQNTEAMEKINLSTITSAYNSLVEAVEAKEEIKIGGADEI